MYGNIPSFEKYAETTHQNWLKRSRTETTQAETTQAERPTTETTQGRNDPRPLRPVTVLKDRYHIWKWLLIDSS